MEEYVIKNSQKSTLIKSVNDQRCSIRFLVNEKCYLKIYLIVSGTSDCRIETEIKGSYSAVDIRLIALTKLTDKLSIHTIQNHIASSSKSSLLVRSLNNDNSMFSFDGIIKVGNLAVLTDGYERSDSLLLSDKAHVLSNPVLEISTNDVRCTHGVTISSIKKEEVEYLNSRGIGLQEARNILAEGFVKSIFEDAEDKYKIALDKSLGNYFGGKHDIS